MYELDKNIYGAINGIDGITASYGYPRNWDVFPMVTYEEGTLSTPAIDMESRKTRSFGAQYYVSVWDRGAKATSALGEKVIAALETAGWHVSSLGLVQDAYDATIFQLRLSAQAHFDMINDKLY